jgi:hypothetical protein
MSSCASFAQEDFSSSDTTKEEHYNTFKERVYFWQMEKNLKVSPFDIFSAVPSLGADLEVKMSEGVSFQYGAAYIPSFFQFTVGQEDDQFQWMNGYKLRFESRFWGFRRPNMYVSTEMSIRHLIISDDISFGMEGDGMGNFAYFIKENITFHRFSTHFNVKLGFQKVLPSNFVIDWYAGLSFRRNNVLSQGTSVEGGVQQFTWNRLEWTLRNKHKFGYALPITGFRIGYHFPSKKRT